MENKQTSTNTVVLLVVGLLAVIGIIIGWVAFNRSGKDLSPTIIDEASIATDNIAEKTQDLNQDTMQNANQTQKDIQYALMKAQLEARLLSIKTQLAANEVTDETMQEIKNLRNDLNDTYTNSSEEAQEQIRDVDSQLAVVEAKARNNTAEALLTMENLIEQVRQDVKADEKNNDSMMENDTQNDNMQGNKTNENMRDDSQETNQNNNSM